MKNIRITMIMIMTLFSLVFANGQEYGNLLKKYSKEELEEGFDIFKNESKTKHTNLFYHKLIMVINNGHSAISDYNMTPSVQFNIQKNHIDIVLIQRLKSLDKTIDSPALAERIQNDEFLNRYQEIGKNL